MSKLFHDLCPLCGKKKRKESQRCRQCQLCAWPTIPLAVRFWRHVDKRGPDECWPWTGGHTRKGYGVFHDVPNHQTTAHRMAWQLANGRPVPDGLEVCHRCDNPPCCNPTHLWIGTVRDNALDMVAKGRQNIGDRRGEKCGNSILTNAEVVAIREYVKCYPRSRSMIARTYNVCRSCIENVVTRKTWSHIP